MKRSARKPFTVARPFSLEGNGRMHIVIAAVVAIAILVRVLFFLKLKGTPFFLQHFSDSRLYVQLASDIASGRGIQDAYFMSPLYPYLLALIRSVTGDLETWARILQIAFGAATAYCTILLGHRLFSFRSGILAGALVAVYAPLVFYDGLLLIESLQTLLLTASLLLLLMALESRRMSHWFLAGLVYGLAVVTRANVLIFLPLFLLLWMFIPSLHGRATTRHVVVYAVTALGMLLPSTVHNISEGKVFLPVTSSFGYNLYAGNNAHAGGLYTMPDPVDLYADPNGRHYVQHQVGRVLDATEVSAWWRDRALSWIGANPGEAAKLMMRKLILFFHPEEIDQLGLSMEFFTERYGKIIAIPQWVFPGILVLAFMGIALAFRKDAAMEQWLPVALLAAYVAATALFFVSGRLRIPVMPLLLLYTSMAIVWGVEAANARDVLRRAVWPLVSGTVVAALLLVFQPVLPRDFSHEYIKLGQIAFDAGDYGEAETHFTASVAERATVFGLTNLGNTLAAQGKFEEAAQNYRAALRIDSTSALTWFNFGNLWMQTNKPPYAYGYWKKALQYNPRLPGARRNLGLLLIQAGRLDEAEAELRSYIALESDEARRAEIRRDLNRIEQLRNRPAQ
jgi:tetratricopeptide (TPR) repeat protein